MFVLYVIPIGNVFADPLDTCGIDSGKYYYIKNVSTGKYLNCTNSGETNGSNVTVTTGAKVKRQRWAIIKDEDKYIIRAVVSEDRRILDITSGNVDVWSDLNASYQRFNLVRTSKGTYYIKNNDKYVVDSSNDAVISSSSSNGTWSFEEVAKNDADIYGFRYPSEGRPGGIYDSTTSFDTFIEGMQTAGYNQYTFTNVSALTGYTNMKTDSIWVFVGHGLNIFANRQKNQT